MKTIEVERYEEHTLLLVQGEDYSRNDLVVDRFTNRLYHMPADKLTAIAKEKGFSKWSWQGHADADESGTIKVKFRKYI